MTSRQKDLGKLLLSRNIAWATTAFVILCMLTLIAPSNSTACTIAEVSWHGNSSLTPINSDYLQNGDFGIYVKSELGDWGPVGDGINETTIWSVAKMPYDPENPEKYPIEGYIDPNRSLEYAYLVLALTPKDSLINTDIIRLEGLGDISTSIIQGLPVDQTSTISLNLLNFYTPAQIAEWYNSSTNPQIIYRDDAIVSSAHLGIRYNTVPEPTTMLLLASGLAGLVGYGRKKFFKR